MGESVFNRPTRLVPGAHGQKLERQTFSLSVKSGAAEGLRRNFDSDCVRVGAGPGNDMVLADPTVSSAHFEIAVVERGFLLRDLGSTNGTTLAGVRIVEAYLPSEAEITAGEVKLQFKAASETVESPLSANENCGTAVGRSPLMREIFARVERVAKTDVTVLITGETGCGKEVIAYSVFEASGRRGGPFVVVDCGAIAPTLIESELFGHEKGAFTGAVAKRVGAFERANNGTLFLDEVGELEMSLQPKLLRALERREVQRVGGTSTVTTDARIIAATTAISDPWWRAASFARISITASRWSTSRSHRYEIGARISSCWSIRFWPSLARPGRICRLALCSGSWITTGPAMCAS